MAEKGSGFWSRIKAEIKIFSLILGLVAMGYGFYDSLSKEVVQTETATQILTTTVSNNSRRIEVLETSVAKSAQERKSADSTILERLNEIKMAIKDLEKP